MADPTTAGQSAVASNAFDDEDLIDYDDDVVESAAADEETEPVEAEDQSQHGPETTLANTVSPSKHSSMDHLEIKPEVNAGTSETHDLTNEDEEISYDVEEGMDDGANEMAVGRENGQQQQDVPNGQDHEDEEIDFGIEEEPAIAQHDSVEGDGEQSRLATTEAPHPSATSVEGVDEAQTAQQNYQAEEGQRTPVGAPASVEANTAAVQGGTSNSPVHNAEADAAEKDEITWEEPEDQIDPVTNASQTNAPDARAADTPESAAQHKAQDEAGQGFGAAEQVELGGHIEEGTNNTDEHEFPNITVQYKGEEFPLFSITSEGFFTSTSVLNENIGSLLAGFRAELADEIAAEDELIFQVDELGLEYAESHSQDLLGHVTLNQILEIFDLLVKNGDPDNERSLYTYLFTKPSTMKRFESLIESAAAGTGLNEVIYHFDSPVPHGANTTGDHMDHSQPELDQFQSPGDAGAEARGEEGEESGEQGQYDYIEDLDDTTRMDTAQTNASHGELRDEAEADPVSKEGGEYLEKASETNLSSTLVQPGTDAEADALGDNDFAMAMDHDSDGNAEGGFDVDDHADDDGQEGILDLANAETSASNTVDNDDNALDMTADEAAEALDQFDETKAPEEVEDEIDWRDDPADEDASTVSAGAAKRSHDTDGVDQADGPDPKRQKS